MKKPPPLYLRLYPSEMLPKRVIFATDVSKSSGAGHFRRLVEISRVVPKSSKLYFFGSIEIPWIQKMSDEVFQIVDSLKDLDSRDLVILDSYNETFCRMVSLEAPRAYLIQIADRYTALLPNIPIIFIDLPFTYADSTIDSRVIAHGIEYLPMRSLAKRKVPFREEARKVLVTTGGLVNQPIFSQLSQELSKERYKKVKFEFIGDYNFSKSDSTNIRFNSFGKRFDSIAKCCDTAISAAGTTLWDLLANKRLVGLAITAENQRANFAYAIENRLAISIFDSDTTKLNVEALQILLFDKHIRESVYVDVSTRYDFGGAERVWSVILRSFTSNLTKDSH